MGLVITHPGSRCRGIKSLLATSEFEDNLDYMRLCLKKLYKKGETCTLNLYQSNVFLHSLTKRVSWTRVQYSMPTYSMSHVCLTMYMCVGGHMYTCACGVQQLVSGVFLNHSLLYFEGQGLLLNQVGHPVSSKDLSVSALPGPALRCMLGSKLRSSCLHASQLSHLCGSCSIPF